MAHIRAFKAVRPKQELACQIAALPYDVVNAEEARDITKNNPYSFLHIDKAEIDLPQDTDPHASIVYETAGNTLRKMIAQGYFIKDDAPRLYIYRLTMDGRMQTGLVSLLQVDEYLNKTIKKHELTREDKELDRINHVRSCQAQTGPIFIAYRAKTEIDTIMNQWTVKNTPVYDLSSDDGVTHTIWVIDDEHTINALTSLFQQVPSLYIADGHHRNAAAVKVCLEERSQNPNYTGEEEFNYYLNVAFAHNQLKILDYNRVVGDLNGLQPQQFLEKISENFEIEKHSSAVNLKEKHTFGMYCDHQWYRLVAKKSITQNDLLIDNLDVSILQKSLLDPILGIKDPRNDKRIDFVGGIRGYNALVERVDSGEMAVAFTLWPVSMDELMQVADQDLIMPPKSTWFEPKLRSGLFIHMLG